MTGRQFNELSKGMRFYKLTTANELHRGFLYRDGLNVDTERFIALPHNPGLHFTEESMIASWVDIFNGLGTPLKWKREVKIADDAKVYYQFDQFKADQLILSPREEL